MNNEENEEKIDLSYENDMETNNTEDSDIEFPEEDLSVLMEKNIIILGGNVEILRFYFTKNSNQPKFQQISKGLKKFIGEKAVYFVNTDHLPDSDIFENIILKIGSEYDNNSFYWYINPYLQSRAVLSQKIPENINLIRTFK